MVACAHASMSVEMAKSIRLAVFVLLQIFIWHYVTLCNSRFFTAYSVM